ncbi:MAG: phosphohistidine phosphatase SixA [Desulfovibrionales bacterium]
MALYLVQHGRNLPKEVDPETSLSQEGREQVTRIASVAAGYHVRVDRIDHSGKKRAMQTAEIFESFLKPKGGVHGKPGLGPLDDVAQAAQGLESGENCMLVGHLPFMERMASFLIIGAAQDRIIRFQHGGIVCLDRDHEGPWYIKWTLMPEIG